MAGWVRGLLGENELAGFRNAQQVFLPLMEYDNFPSTLHEVKRGNPPPWRIGHRQGRRLVSGVWGLCHALLHLPRDGGSFLSYVEMIMITVFTMRYGRA
jgi:hypothetical protein